MDIQNKISDSTKWALIAEISAKLIMPISNMILARILTPAAFGILATVQMVLSFADMLADAGFQKYIVQKEFDSNQEREESILVAIYTNIALGFLLWFLLIIFNKQLADFVGNPGLGHILIIAGVNIPIVAFTSVQLAVMRRNFQFKKLLLFRMIIAFTPIFITVPLAYIGFEYWALIIGFISAQILQAIAIFINGDVRLRYYFSVKHLFKMLPFASWTLIECLFIWITVWADTFFIAHSFDSYHLGLYKMSGVAVAALLSIIMSSVLPVMYSALSRLQFNKQEYSKVFENMQERLCIIMIPLGFGLYAYKDLACTVLFGNAWHEADLLIGLNGLANCLVMVYCYPCSEVYRSKGMPMVSTLAQILHLVVLVPVIYYFTYNFNLFVVARNIVKLQFILVHFILMSYFVKMRAINLIINTWQYLLCSIFILIFAVYTRQLINNVIYDWFSMGLCVFLYFGILVIFTSKKRLIMSIFMKKRLF